MGSLLRGEDGMQGGWRILGQEVHGRRLLALELGICFLSKSFRILDIHFKEVSPDIHRLAEYKIRFLICQVQVSHGVHKDGRSDIS